MEGSDSAARLTAVVSGHVQGVGFRYWVQQRARSLGLAGSAVNLDDGRVRVIVEGARAACDELAERLRGPDAPGRVRDVALRWADATGEAADFRVG